MYGSINGFGEFHDQSGGTAGAVEPFLGIVKARFRNGCGSPDMNRSTLRQHCMADRDRLHKVDLQFQRREQAPLWQGGNDRAGHRAVQQRCIPATVHGPHWIAEAEIRPTLERDPAKLSLHQMEAQHTGNRRMRELAAHHAFDDFESAVLAPCPCSNQIVKRLCRPWATRTC